MLRCRGSIRKNEHKKSNAAKPYDLFNHSYQKEMRYLCVYYTAKPLMLSNNFEQERKIESVYSKKDGKGSESTDKF